MWSFCYTIRVSCTCVFCERYDVHRHIHLLTHSCPTRRSSDLFRGGRQLAPTETGLPLEIYAYTANTSWAVHEDVQGDTFDHLIAILPEFGLRLFHQPTGLDLARFGAASAALRVGNA